MSQETHLSLADFEKAMAELESLVTRMESGKLSLEDALGEFERGIALTRQCQQVLMNAEQKVRQLSANGEETPVSLSNQAHDGAGDGE